MILQFIYSQQCLFVLSTASPILTTLFDAATKRNHKIKHLRLLVTKKLESMDLSEFENEKDVDCAFQLLCLASIRQSVVQHSIRYMKCFVYI